VDWVLAGKRRIDYVRDILKEIGSSVEKKERRSAWMRLAERNTGTALHD
jgi:hypothetical protein